MILDGSAVFTTPGDDRERMAGGAASQGRVLSLGDHDVTATFAVDDIRRNWMKQNKYNNKNSVEKIKRDKLFSGNNQSKEIEQKPLLYLNP